jgi:hypothetical protein
MAIGVRWKDKQRKYQEYDVLDAILPLEYLLKNLFENVKIAKFVIVKLLLKCTKMQEMKQFL